VLALSKLDCNLTATDVVQNLIAAEQHFGVSHGV